MSNALPTLPLLTPFLDPRNGLVSKQWAAYLRELDIRVGGRTGQSTTAIASQVVATQNDITTLESEISGIGQGRTL